MGLEIVEFVMEAEEEFGFRIPDDEAAELVTVGQFCGYVVRRLKEKLLPACPSRTVFYQLRRALIGAFGVGRGEVAPGARVECLLPAFGFGHAWTRLGRRLDFRLPALRIPESGCGCVALLSTILAFALALVVFSHPSISRLGSTGALAFVFVGFVGILFVALSVSLLWLLSFFGSSLPPGCNTVRELVAAVVRMNYGRTDQQKGGKVEATVKEFVRGYLVDHFGVPPEKIRDDARFVQDLDLG